MGCAFRLLVPAVVACPLPLRGAGAAELDHLAPHLDGGDLILLWALPFAGILLSIALFPLFAPSIWHHHYGKISAGWAALFLALLVVGFVYVWKKGALQWD